MIEFILAFIGALVLGIAAWTDIKTSNIPPLCVYVFGLLSLILHWELGTFIQAIACGSIAYLFARFVIPDTNLIGGGDIKLLIVMAMWFSNIWYLQFFFLSIVFDLLQALIRRRRDDLRYGLSVFLSFIVLEILIHWIR